MPGALHGVVTIDGPSGSGKSTVARKLASRFDVGYLDTGAMYRAMTLAVLRADIALGDSEAILELSQRVRLEVGTDPSRPSAVLDGEDISAEIRDSAVTKAVSEVSAIAELRAQLVKQQREIIDEVLARSGGVVVEGRDIGTVVVPESPLKVYLTASVDVRAARRTKQDLGGGRESVESDVRQDIERRDHHDSSRPITPLQAAPDAVVLDTTELNIDQVIIALGELAHQRGMLTTQTSEGQP